ncbi:MAG: porphobilinogen synthase [Magnetococcales bacterium]|nr:porphobilinogen synthase [Magnetococcales bacterium]NGZ25770.1 porphobilinogen synthase [Magnetococcales bacterium]
MTKSIHFSVSAQVHRPRRLRANPAIRRMVQETMVQPADLIQPYFLVPGKEVVKPVSAMPGVFQLSVDQAIPLARQAMELGVGGVILFGIPAIKDSTGSDARDDNGLIQSAIRTFKEALPDLYLIADACYCEYTDHGHCGILHNGDVDNDATLEILGEAAISYAKAGVDMVAPSGMMDGGVATIRGALDQTGFTNIPIMAYAAKYVSAFYGPFGIAAQNAPKSGDRRTYQMDPANRREALREVALDVQQGADVVMVKPGLAYLDIIREVRDHFDVPVAAYNVSGEYAMVKAAAMQGWINEDRMVMEILTSFKRAGADMILTYHATHAAQLLQNG